jgi:hypothetical protein
MKHAIREHMIFEIRRLLDDHIAHVRDYFAVNRPPELTADAKARLGSLVPDIVSGKPGTPIRLARIGQALGRPDIFWPLVLDAFDAEDVRSDDGPSECAAVLRACP